MVPAKVDDPLIFIGKETKVTCPSGKVVSIRETNGEDDELLSSIADAQTGENVLKFLSNIITQDEDLKRKPLTSEVGEYLVNDKYYLLFKQRIINHGNEFQFEYKCQNSQCGKSTKYTEDLNELDGDLGDPEYKPNLISVFKYPNGDKKELEFTTSSGKKVKYALLTSLLEYKKLGQAEGNNNKNTPLYEREIKLWNNNEWQLITQFRMFSSREMDQIRANVVANDKQFDPISEFKCKHCNTPYAIAVMAIPAFYYPEG